MSRLSSVFCFGVCVLFCAVVGGALGDELRQVEAGVVALEPREAPVVVKPGSARILELEPGEERRTPVMSLRSGLGGWRRTQRVSAGGHLLLVTDPVRIPQLCVDAIEVAPSWVREDLEDAFARLGSSALVYAELLLDLENPNWIDEVAFQIAHVAPSELRRLASWSVQEEDLLVKNAEMIYRNAGYLNYARLVEHGDAASGGDFWTTVAYWVEQGGQRVQKELPMQCYYWYIVHPKLNNETPKMDDRPSVQQRTYGYFWREFLFYDPSKQHSYVSHYFEYQPNSISAEELAALSAMATGHLESRTFDFLPVVVDQDDGGVVLGEMRYGLGEIIATTLRLEEAYQKGQSRLLENVVLYGNCNTLLPEGSPVLVVRDRGPSVVEEILQQRGYQVRVITSERLGQVALGPYAKIIVPSDQPRKLYQALETYRGRITDWLAERNVFEFHGACQAEDSWTDLSLPGLIESDDLGEVGISNLAFGGYPLLSEVMSRPEVLWDGKMKRKQGQKPFRQDECALVACGKWVNRVVPVLARLPRSVQPNQIAVEHNGNCGENQDILMAAARASLIPVAAVDAMAEDHVWCEVFEDGWHFYETWLGGGYTNVEGHGSGVLDVEYGGRYEFSGVYRWRNDGLCQAVTDRYTSSCVFEPKITDRDGVPVDGALVKVYAKSVWGYYEVCARDYTDESGTARIVLGDHRTLYARVESSLGSYPEGDNMIERFASNTVKDKLYLWERSLPGKMPRLEVFETPPPEQEGGTFLQISFELPYQTLYCENLIDHNEGAKKVSPGHIDFLICNRSSFEKLGGGQAVPVFEVLRDVTSATMTFPVARGLDYYLVFSNVESLNLNQALWYSIDLVARHDGEAVVLDSLSNWVRVPAGTNHAIMVRQEENLPPVIVEAGFMSSAVSSSVGGSVKVVAYVVDPQGWDDIEQVEVFYNDEPTGLFLVDDATCGDGVAGDSIFTLEMDVGPGLYAGRHLVEIVARDRAGNQSVAWPYLQVGQGVSRRVQAERSSSKLDGQTLAEAGRRVRDALLADWPTPDAAGQDMPVIMAGGFDDSDVTADGGRLVLLAHVEFYGKGQESVEAFLQGGVPLGVFLRDDGMGADAVAGDGLFTYEAMLAGPVIPGRYLIEIMATASDGTRSNVFPYLTVSE